MNFIHRYISFTDKLNANLGKSIAWLSLVLVLIVCFDVFTRYFLKSSSVAVQEIQWHLFSVIFLMGAAYTLKIDGHVRVDLLYSRLSEYKKAIINIFGVIIFFIPFCLLIIYASKDFVLISFNIGETSPDPGGLPARYVLKSLLPISFFFLLLQGISLLLKSFLIIYNKRKQTG